MSKAKRETEKVGTGIKPTLKARARGKALVLWRGVLGAGSEGIKKGPRGRLRTETGWN